MRPHQRRRGVLAVVLGGVVAIGVLAALQGLLRGLLVSRAAVPTIAADRLDSIIDGASGLLGTLLKPVVNFVRSVIRPIWSWITEAVDRLWDGIRNVGDWAGRALDGVWDATVRGLRSVEAWARGAVDWLRGQINAVSDWAGRAIDWAIRNVTEWVRDSLGWLGRQIDGVFDWVTDNVWRPLIGFIDRVYDWVRDHVWDPLVRRIGDVLGWATRAVDRLWDTVRDVWDFINRYARRLLAVVDKAWDWLVFMATHPFTWWRELTEGLFQRAPRWMVAQIMGGIGKAADDVEGWIVRWLG